MNIVDISMKECILQFKVYVTILSLPRLTFQTEFPVLRWGLVGLPSLFPAFTHNYFQVSKSILNEERKILDSPHFDDELHVLKKERTMVAEQVRASGGAKRKILPGTAGKILTEIWAQTSTSYEALHIYDCMYMNCVINQDWLVT